MKVCRAYRMRINNLLAICAAVMLNACAETSEFDRGPYLQSPSSTSIIIKWRFSEEALAQVRYGTSPGALTELVERESDSFEHEILLTDLVPDTVYYYSVNDDENIEHSFRTPPPEGDARPTRIWVVGDSGTADSNARSVRNAFYDFNQGSASDLMIMLGDNAYQNGTQTDYQQAFFEMYPATIASTPVMPTIGNHDARADNGAAYFDIFNLPQDGSSGGVPSGTEAYYSFNYANIHFVSLDSEVSDRSPTGAMYSWLVADLAASTQDWVVVYFHHPPYSKGTHDSDTAESPMSEMRENYTDIFELYGVDLVFAGHSHNYERSFPIHGHRGSSDTFLESMKTDSGDGRKDGDGEYQKLYNSSDSGVIYTVAGTSGKTRSAPLNHPVHYVAMSELGSVVLDFDGDQVNVTFVSPNPAAIDYFTVVKSI